MPRGRGPAINFGSVVVIMLTAKAQEPDVQLGIHAGADDYIVKPFSPRALVDQVQAVYSDLRSIDDKCGPTRSRWEPMHEAVS